MIVLAVGTAYALKRLTGKYAALSRTSHFAECATRVASLKPALQRRLQGTYDPNGPPEGFLSNAGLVVAYSIVEEGDECLHHLSMSYRRGYLARATALWIIAFIGELSRFDLERLRVFDTVGGVVHAEMRLTQIEQEDWQARQVEIPQGPELEKAVRRAWTAKDALLPRLERGVNPYQ